MPLTYPPPPPTVDSGGIETISRFLNTPSLVARRLRTLAENRFIGDTLLSGRVPASGGAVQFEQSESIYPDRTAEAIEPGGDFPISSLGLGPSVIAAVKKWGLDALVVDEAVRRLLMNPVDRALTKLVNGVVKQVDSVVLTAINAAPILTFAAPTAWATSTRILRDLLTAVAQVRALNQGYDPDTVVLDDLTFALMMSDVNITNALRRESGDAPVYTGNMGRIAGLDVLTTPNLPTAGRAYVLDRKVVGGMADEVPLSSNSIREEKNERWRLRAKRIVVPYVQEPSAVVAITGI